MVVLSACAATDPGSPAPEPPAPPTETSPATPTPDTPPTAPTTPPTAPATAQDLQTIDLALDLAALTATAAITARPDAAGRITLDVSGLTVTGVTVDGAPQPIDAPQGLLVLTAPGPAATVVVDYQFPARGPGAFDGWMPERGVTFLWPDFCANLYPCDPLMSDGVTFGLSVTGIPAGATAVYPSSTYGDGPAYLPAVAVGDYLTLPLGATTAGTTLSAYYLDRPAGLDRATQGTSWLVAAFDFFEQTYGPYGFGPTYGTVEVDWGWDSWGGMEHHPISHVGMFDFNDIEVQVHEAGHGWYGDGVRIACWEDFVLSEGTNTYITARALTAVGGPDLWPYYVDDFLVPSCETMGGYVNPIVMPSGCNDIVLLEDDLWSLATYMKGACYYGEVADLIGADALDAAIASFYQDHVHGSATMEEMLTRVEAFTDPADLPAVRALATDWLQTEACPVDYAARCRTRAP